MYAYAQNLRYVPNSSRTFFSLPTPNYFVQMANYVASVSTNTLRNMALYTFYKQSFPLLSTPYLSAQKDLAYLINGVTNKPPFTVAMRENYCNYEVVSDLELLMGHYFVQKVGIDEEYKEHINDLIDNIQDAFYDRLQDNVWMDAVTLSAAEEKLSSIKRRVCFPDDWSPVLDIDQRIGILSPLSYFDNAVKIKKAYDNRSFELLKTPVDPYDWSFDTGFLGKYTSRHFFKTGVVGANPDIVNAFYSPNQNTITIPAGITQSPMLYSYTWRKSPLSAIYGTLGAVIAHELCHGFDSNGRHYDYEGGFTDWWSRNSDQQFQIKAQCIVDSRSAIETQVPGLFVDGYQTLGENIADICGLNVALNAMYLKRASMPFEETSVYDSSLEQAFPGFSELKLFFIFYAQMWGEVRTDASLIALIEGNPHAPSEARVLGTLRDMPEFSREFECQKGDYYYASDPCNMW
jgi:predicted metalloendopeptidase